MKKSLITIITLLLVLINLVLTALLTFTIIPETKKANDLITKVAGAIDLDLTAGGATTANGSTGLTDKEVYTIDDAITVNLKSGTDGTAHYASISKITLTINKKSEGYATYGGENMKNYNGIITDTVSKIVSKYTVDELQAKSQEAKDDVKDELAKSFGGDLVTSVGWTATLQ
jgi:flagellar FliL protein